MGKVGAAAVVSAAYSPELNAIEILGKHAKYFWRRFLVLSGLELQHELDARLRGFGSEHTITFQ